MKVFKLAIVHEHRRIADHYILTRGQLIGATFSKLYNLEPLHDVTPFITQAISRE